jgi:hypothetical protein
MHELILRGIQTQKIPAIARWMASTDGHDNLPLTLTALEGHPALSRHHLDGSSSHVHRASGYGSPVPDAPSGDVRVPACRETTTPEDATAIGAAVANWIEASNGRGEARVYELTEALTVDAIAATLASLGLQCLHGTPGLLQIRECSPTGAWQLLFQAASVGGAHSSGEGGAGGRLAAWRSIAALTASPPETPISEVETRAQAYGWYTFDTTGSSWFAQDDWDIGLIAVAPDHRRLAILAATDTD